MHRTSHRARARIALAACAAAIGLLPGLLPAQEKSDAAAPATTLSQGELAEIVVTGSRIARPDLTAISPIAIVGADDIKLSNATTVEEFLRKTPQFAPAIGSNTNNGNEGAATIDLRNLGEERTLVLVDGKRFVPYDYQGFVDVSMIPTSLIERVEIITGGASAVYGADAIAGVVNFILKKDFEGLEVNGSTSRSGHNDADTYDFNVTAGGNFAGGRGNVVMNFGYNQKQTVTQDERSYSRNALDNLLQPGGSYAIPGATAFDTGYTGDPLDTCLQFTNAGDISGTCDPSFNFNKYNLLQTPQKLWTGTALAKYEISDNLEAFARASFANNRVDTVIAPTATFFNTFQYHYLDNPFLAQSVRDRWALVDAEDASPGDGIVSVDLGRRLVEAGTRDTLYENTAYQFVGGLQGRVWEDHKWEVFGQYGHTARSQTFINDINIDKARLAADAVDDGSGNAVCRINADADPNNDDPACVAANFIGEGNLNPAVLPYIAFGNLLEVDKTNQQIFGASISGPIAFQLPSASKPLGYAVGVESRKEQGDARPDSNYEAGLAPGFGSSSTVEAEIKISEIFGELLVPVVTDAKFARAINIETGVRYAQYKDDTTIGGNSYDNTFYNTSWKLGADWKPVDELRFSVMFQHAVRAPTLQEIGLPVTSSTGDLVYDPCDSDVPPTNPNLIALCEATGVPVGQVGNFVGISAGQVNNFVGGNPSLEPEDADTWTVGLDWQSSAIEGLEVKLDYYDIDINNAIVEISEQNIINGCYRVEQDPNGFFCSRIHRNTTTGSLLGNPEFGIDKSRVNAARETAKGLDVMVSYAFEIGDLGAIDLGLNANYVFERITQDADNTPANDCAGLAGKTCLRPLPKLTFVQTTRWTRGAATVQLAWRYLDPVKQDALNLEAFLYNPVTNPEGLQASAFAVRKMPSQSYFDLTGSYAIDDTWTVRAGINNLLDNDPPVVGNEWGGTTENSGNTYPATYDPLGRIFSLGVNAKF